MALPWIIFRISFLEQNVTMELNANQSAEKVWEVVSNWNNLNQLVPAVVDHTEVRGKGNKATWDIFLKNGKVVKEKMIAFDEKHYSMTYIMTDTPMPLQDYQATIQVLPINEEQSKVIFSTDFKVEEENRESLRTTFQNFQTTYLNNVANWKLKKEAADYSTTSIRICFS